MKMKMKNVIQMYDALLALSQTEAPFRVNYWIMINTNALQPHFDAFSKERDSIYSDCLYKGTDGAYVHANKDGELEFNVIDSKKPSWITRFNKLNDFDVDFSPNVLDLDLLASENPSWNFKANLLYTLKPLINQGRKNKAISRRRKNGANHQTTKN